MLKIAAWATMGCFFLCCIPRVGSEEIPLAPAEERALAERQRITQGSYRLHCKEWAADSVDPIAEKEYLFWFDYSGATSQRQDEINFSPNVSVSINGLTSPRKVVTNDGCSVTRKVRTHDRFFFWTADELDDGTRMSAQTGELRFAESYTNMMIDPLVVGMVCSRAGHLYTQNLRSTVGHASRINLRFERAIVEGQAVEQVTYSVPEFHKNVRLLFAPDKGWSPISCEIELPDRRAPGATYLHKMSVEVAAIGADQLWFPKLITLKGYRRPAELGQESASEESVYKEELEVSDVHLNEPIPPETFNFAGMEIPPGTIIDFISDQVEPMRKWNGKEAVFAAPQRGHDEIQPRANRPYFIMLLNVLLVGAGFVYFGLRTWSRPPIQAFK